MKNIVAKTIKTHNLIFPGARVLLALSGGSDSVCLLHVLNDLREEMHFELFAAHLNHGIREEADDDCKFVQKLCADMGITCFTKKADIKKLANERKISEELAGREERYKLFDEILKKENIDLIATAHNKNDAAETILMHIIRGSGINGMKGIAYKRGNIIRPLLDAEKTQIEQFCHENGYCFVTDKTNSECIYTRNKIRLELIPMICRNFNPSFMRVLVQNAAIISDDADFLDCEAKKLYKENVHGGGADTADLKKMPKAIRRRIILLMYQSFSGKCENIQSVYTESILKILDSEKSGSSVDLCGGIECVIETGKLFFRKKNNKTKNYEYKIEPEKRTQVPEAGLTLTLTEWKGCGEKFFFDSTENIMVRNRRQGDVFFPTGMKGRKKLSDYFTDEKIPLSERDKIPVITCGGEPVWIVGKRRDRRYLKGKKAYTFIVERQGGENFAAD